MAEADRAGLLDFLQGAGELLGERGRGAQGCGHERRKQFEMHCRLRCELTKDCRSLSMWFKSAQSGSDFDVASGRVLDRYQFAAAGLARRYFGGGLPLDPLEPVRPPRTVNVLRLLEAGIEAGGRWPRS